MTESTRPTPVTAHDRLNEWTTTAEMTIDPQIVCDSLEEVRGLVAAGDAMWAMLHRVEGEDFGYSIAPARKEWEKATHLIACEPCATEASEYSRATRSDPNGIPMCDACWVAFAVDEEVHDDAPQA